MDWTNTKIDFPLLETERMYLRTLTLEDAKGVYCHFSDTEVTKYMDIEPCRSLRKQKKLFSFILMMRVVAGE